MAAVEKVMNVLTSVENCERTRRDMKKRMTQRERGKIGKSNGTRSLAEFKNYSLKISFFQTLHADNSLVIKNCAINLIPLESLFFHATDGENGF